MAYEKGDGLDAFNAELAAHNMRGQWLSDERRDSGAGGAWQGDTWEPHPRGRPYIWKWRDTEPLLEGSGSAIEESARLTSSWAASTSVPRTNSTVMLPTPWVASP